MKRISRLFCVTLVFTMAMSTIVSCGQGNEEARYNDACAFIENGDYEKAYAAFKELGDYKDSQKYLSRFIFFPTTMNYVLEDRSGVMTVELGMHNMPSRMLTEGVEGEENNAYTKDGVYTYDSKGNLMRQVVTYNETLLAYDYTYDNNNRLIKAESSVEGIVRAVHGYAYDENGLLIRESYTEDDVVHYDYENSYDAKGNRIKSEFKALEGDYVYIYAYDDDGNLVNESGSVPDGYWYNVDYTYNSDGELTQEVASENGELHHTIDYTYDNAGNCIKEETNYFDGKKMVLTREYDAHGNVTKEVVTDTDGMMKSLDCQYVLTYLTVDVPVATMNQIMGIFDLI